MAIELKVKRPKSCREIPAGTRFGKLTVLDNVLIPHKKSFRRKLKCICDCGSITYPFSFSLTGNKTVSCGCFHKQNTSNLQRERKLKGNKFKFPKEYKIWQGVKARCSFQSATGYSHYGGRGITFDPRWNTFPNFLEDMGPCPDKNSSIERRDPNGNYTKDNCFWLPRNLQSRNTRRTKKYNFRGKFLSLPEIAGIAGVPSKKLYSRFITYNNIRKRSIEEVIECLKK